MKHTLKVTLIIIALFLIAQLVGLVTINRYLQVNENAETGEVTISYPDTVLGPPAQVENKSTSFLFIGLFVLIGTGLFLLIVKYRVYRVWKLWFFLAVWATVSVALGVYLDWIVAAAIAFGLGLWKIFRPNVYIYNFTEIFIYTGIAILMLSVLNLFAAFGLLVLISLYDMYAVWKSKHMVTMAKFQT
ncbi:MAG: presenilin family intramembrane aspartyl protease, partial [Candidatus Woesearchaeota archaeon]|nr:presenilin family intramembrane aspartyl protease [Candidatus Woesearchaeota archaeon]